MMTSKPSTGSTASGIRLEAMLDATHPLMKLAQHIDWEMFTQQFGSLYAEAGEGRPSGPVRVMVGLHYLKHLFNESDESVVTKWVENPYWQYFCGCETFQHDLPCHPTSLQPGEVASSHRSGGHVEGMEQLLKGVITTAMQVDALKPHSILDPAGNGRHDGAGEGHRLPDRRTLVSQGAPDVGASSQA